MEDLKKEFARDLEAVVSREQQIQKEKLFEQQK